MATVPAGKVRVIGGRAYGPGAELPGTPKQDTNPVSAPVGGSGDALGEDFPYRDLLAAGGITTRARLASASDDELIALDGIGEARLKEIRKAAK
jgi:hypothetical protein